MRFAARTHPGRRDGENEDSMGWDESQALWFVADGMGGHASGDVASRIVKETLLASASLPLISALDRAHAAILEAAAHNPAYQNMGSTAVAIRLGEGSSEIVWVGDSRAYLWRKGTLKAVTRDHSFLELLREHQPLTEAELRDHPQRNLITQTIGIGTPKPSVMDLAMRHGDWLLLCSDGLNDELENHEIAQVLRAYAAPDTAADGLIEAVLAKGGRDNVSVVIVEYDGADGAERIGAALPVTSASSSRAKSSRLWIMAGILALAVVALVRMFLSRGRLFSYACMVLFCAVQRASCFAGSNCAANLPL